MANQNERCPKSIQRRIRLSLVSPNFEIYDRSLRLQPDETAVYLGVKALKAPSRLGLASYIPDIRKRQTRQAGPRPAGRR